ncbi:argininosuccinate lyase [Paracoccus sp. 11-3]|uniref:Argininosuccinate lyase n=1 Tax=Paracoccus amoyensis TaxID=2760093 RepID=A0A926GGH1_9RHOB|nr:argininosuccinate lyase [Paracoccus amoyensis]MBC9247847.1 argininosuccinate lyase [Paracoccus amoyensis]
MKGVGLVVAAAVVMVLQGCGVDGPPERPAAPATAPKSNVSISGYGVMGVQTEL